MTHREYMSVHVPRRSPNRSPPAGPAARIAAGLRPQSRLVTHKDQDALPAMSQQSKHSEEHVSGTMSKQFTSSAHVASRWYYLPELTHTYLQDFLLLRVFVAWHLIDGLVGVVRYLVPP